MFGFLISGATKNDAAVLKKLTDSILKKYIGINAQQLKDLVQNDFDSDNYAIDNDGVRFVFDELQNFTFTIKKEISEDITTTVHVRAEPPVTKYYGYSLMVQNGDWYSIIRDGMEFPATGAAKNLAKAMKDKYDIYVSKM